MWCGQAFLYAIGFRCRSPLSPFCDYQLLSAGNHIDFITINYIWICYGTNCPFTTRMVLLAVLKELNEVNTPAGVNVPRWDVPKLLSAAPDA